MATVLTPTRDIPAFAVITRVIHCRGADQQNALHELSRRGLWLSNEQVMQSGLTDTHNILIAKGEARP